MQDLPGNDKELLEEISDLKQKIQELEQSEPELMKASNAFGSMCAGQAGST